MASGVYDVFVEDMLQYIFNVAAPTEYDDLYASLQMTNFSFTSTHASVNDITLDTADSSYGGDAQMGSETVINSDAFDAADVSFASLGGGATRNYSGTLIYDERGAATSDTPVVWVEFGSAVTSAATQVDVTWNAAGIIQLT